MLKVARRANKFRTIGTVIQEGSLTIPAGGGNVIVQTVEDGIPTIRVMSDKEYKRNWQELKNEIGTLPESFTHIKSVDDFLDPISTDVDEVTDSTGSTKEQDSTEATTNDAGSTETTVTETGSTTSETPAEPEVKSKKGKKKQTEENESTGS